MSTTERANNNRRWHNWC